MDRQRKIWDDGRNFPQRGSRAADYKRNGLGSWPSMVGFGVFICIRDVVDTRAPVSHPGSMARYIAQRLSVHTGKPAPIITFVCCVIIPSIACTPMADCARRVDLSPSGRRLTGEAAVRACTSFGRRLT
jgi:hypothetical protein